MVAVEDPAEEAESWPMPRPYVPGAPLPGPRADGLTGNWAEVIKEAKRAREAMEAAQFPVPAGPRHALQRWALSELAQSAAYWARRMAEPPARYVRRRIARMRAWLTGPL